MLKCAVSFDRPESMQKPNGSASNTLNPNKGWGYTGALPALGLMTTLGAIPCPDLVGVPGAPGPPMPPVPDCKAMKGPPDGAALGAL